MKYLPIGGESFGGPLIDGDSGYGHGGFGTGQKQPPTRKPPIWNPPGGQLYGPPGIAVKPQQMPGDYLPPQFDAQGARMDAGSAGAPTPTVDIASLDPSQALAESPHLRSGIPGVDAVANGTAPAMQPKESLGGMIKGLPKAALNGAKDMAMTAIGA